MNETERERIMQMVSDGTLRPNEAAQLLAALNETQTASGSTSAEAPKQSAKPKPEMMEVQMQRPDGSHYTVEVPPSLVPMLMKMAGVAIKESARTATIEAWAGFKTMVRNKTEEVKETVKTSMSGSRPKAAVPTEAVTKTESGAEARRRLIQMVQNGRISAADAARLIEQLDALQAYQTSHPAPSPAK